MPWHSEFKNTQILLADSAVPHMIPYKLSKIIESVCSREPLTPPLWGLRSPRWKTTVYWTQEPPEMILKSKRLLKKSYRSLKVQKPLPQKHCASFKIDQSFLQILLWTFQAMLKQPFLHIFLLLLVFLWEKLKNSKKNQRRGEERKSFKGQRWWE